MVATCLPGPEGSDVTGSSYGRDTEAFFFCQTEFPGEESGWATAGWVGGMDKPATLQMGLSQAPCRLSGPCSVWKWWGGGSMDHDFATKSVGGSKALIFQKYVQHP